MPTDARVVMGGWVARSSEEKEEDTYQCCVVLAVRSATAALFLLLLLLLLQPQPLPLPLRLSLLDFYLIYTMCKRHLMDEAAEGRRARRQRRDGENGPC